MVLVVEAQEKPSIHKPLTCWAHTRRGHRCRRRVHAREGEPIPIPYCDRHLQSGDAALKVVNHPFAGKCLVARYALPKNYRVAFFGRRGRCAKSDKEDRSMSYYPPNPKSGSNYEEVWEDGRRRQRRKTNNYNGVINPAETGDVMQYAACPGPDEKQNLRSTFQYFGVRNGTWAAMEFVTNQPVPPNTQLCLWYGAHWWSARGIRRRNVATSRYPAPTSRRSLREE